MATRSRRVLRLREVQERVPLSRVQIWRKSRDPKDDFPAAIELGPNSTGWFDDEIDTYLATRPRRGASPSDADAAPVEAAPEGASGGAASKRREPAEAAP